MSLDFPRGTSNLLSLGVHAAAVLLLLLIGNSGAARREPPAKIRFVPLLSPFHRAAVVDSTGRGGGGQRSATPPSKGPLPRAARQQFVPPILRLADTTPKLVMEPTVVTTAELHMPATPLIFGDPNGVPGSPSGGPGSGGGIGDTKGTGIGHRWGPGAGDDDNDGVATARNLHVTRPVLVWKVDPDYSEAARKAKFQGAVMLRVDIGPDGMPHNIHVDEPLGLGLDEKAIDAVRQWKFRPGTRNGRPVAMSAVVEVHFRLL